MSRRFLITLLPPLFLLALNSCGGSGSGSGSTTYRPTRIVASWTGGAAGPPNDRKDTEATEFPSPMCPASSAQFENQTDGAVLTLINNCSSLLTLYVCQTKGGLTQPSLGLEECASDPLQTPLSQFKTHPITPLLGGGAKDFRNATSILSINVFFCSTGWSLFLGSDGLECI